MSAPEAAGAYTLPDYAGLEFPDPVPERPYVLLNMVISVDGKIVIEGTERGLGSPQDQHLMRALRTHADVVLNGAGTLRASGSSPLVGDPALEATRRARGRGAPVGAVISASGALPLGDRFFTSREFEAIVFLAGAPGDRREAIEATGRRVVDLPDGSPAQQMRAMLRWMRDELDARVLLVEGGAQLNGELLDAGLVDEVFITVGGLIVGGHETRTAVSSARAPSLDAVTRLDLVSAVPAFALNEVYLRYRVAR